MKFNEMKWGGRVMPTPLSKTMKLPRVENSFICISTNTEVNSTLHLSNLTLSKTVYCLMVQDESPSIEIQSTVPYLLYSNVVSEPYPVVGEFSSLVVDAFSAKPVMIPEPCVLRITNRTLADFRIIDADSEVVYDGNLTGEIELDYAGEWIAFECPTKHFCHFEVSVL